MLCLSADTERAPAKTTVVRWTGGPRDFPRSVGAGSGATSSRFVAGFAARVDSVPTRMLNRVFYSTDRSANAGTDAARSLYAAASEGTVQSSSEKRPDFSVGGDDGMAAAPRKVNDRASRTKELRKQANADANDASVRNLDKRRARRKYRAEFIQAVQRCVSFLLR